MSRPYFIFFISRQFHSRPWNIFMESWIGLATLLLLTSMSQAAAFPLPEGGDLEELSRQKAHHANPRFINPWLPRSQTGSIWGLLRWLLSPNPYAKAKRRRPSYTLIPPREEEIRRGGDSITYLGHASLWIRLGGRDIFTDPVFGDLWPWYRRHLPFPFPAENVPLPHFVLISHDHYDHLDKDSLQRLGTAPLYLVPLGHRDWFARHLPGARVIELDWFESFDQGGISFCLLPAQHWCKRTHSDTNLRLWGSWYIQNGQRKVYFSGDSGYFYGFAEYGRKFGPLDVAILPIGAYEPRWFMKDHHMSPEEAIKAFLDLKAKVMIPQQWGVFDLTDEPLDLPPRAYRKAAQAAGLAEDRTPLLLPGQTWFFPGGRSEDRASSSID